MGLPLHFIKNITTDDWLCNPIYGHAEGDFDEAHPFTSFGEAMSVMDHVQTYTRRLSKRVIGFMTRREADVYTIITMTLGDPAENLGDHRGEVAEGDDLDGEDEEFEDSAEHKVRGTRRWWQFMKEKTRV